MSKKTSQPPPSPIATGTGARFLADRLPLRYRPDQSTIARLAPKVEQLLAAGWSEADLERRLTGGADSDHSPAATVVRRVERFPLPKGVPTPERPPWCGECDEHTRLRENAAGDPVRCPDCHPRCVAAPPAAS
jgi:hypothetical protein